MKKVVKIVVALVITFVLSGVAVLTNSVKGFAEIGSMLSIRPANIIKVLIMISFVLAIKWIVEIILETLNPKSSRGQTAKTIILSLIQYLAVIVMLCWGFVLLGVNVSTVLASVGILALIIGFGAESLIEDVITGLFMLFENQYNVGDIIEVSDFRGTVVSIGIRTTTLQDVGGNKKIINNSAMKNILNRSTVSSKAVCDIGIGYDADLVQLEAYLPEITKKIGDESNIMINVEYLGVQELGQSAVILRFVADVHEMNLFKAQRELNRAIYLELGKKGYAVPYNQVDVHTK